jgi:2-methylcitrate dehydratase PrpD
LVNSKVGQSFSVDVPLAKGEPENPASDADFIAKFKQNSTQYSDAITTKVLDVTLALDQHSVEDLTKALSRLAP